MTVWTLRSAVAGLVLIGVAGCGTSRHANDEIPMKVAAINVGIDVREGIGGEIQGRCVAFDENGHETAYTLTDQSVTAVRVECALQNTGWGSSSLRFRVKARSDIIDGISCEAEPVPEVLCEPLRSQFGFRAMCNKFFEKTENVMRKTSPMGGEFACSVPAGSDQSGMLVIEASHKEPVKTEADLLKEAAPADGSAATGETPETGN